MIYNARFLQLKRSFYLISCSQLLEDFIGIRYDHFHVMAKPKLVVFDLGKYQLASVCACKVLEPFVVGMV